MKTSIFNNFITGYPQNFNSQSSNSTDIELVTKRKAKPNFDINAELVNRTFIRPLPPKGHIVKSNILSAPLNFVQDIKTDFVALKSASKGDANDYQLGRLNDLGMKLGGLAIATYLFSIKKAPVPKAMEFVGLGSFFASMALWPKIALEIPARLIHGFSPFMRYEDSQGRKKGFFSDNQFIPFDMLSDKDITRIGNRLHIPKDLVNRREAVEEKMRQIALQNNTMWMLTAGFATPIMSSLICNVLEPHVDNINNYLTNKRVSNILNNFSAYSQKFRDESIIKQVDSILAKYDGKAINSEIIEELSSALTSELDNNVKIGVKKDLETLFVEDKYKISKSQLKEIQSTVEGLIRNTAAENLLPQTINEIIPTEDQIKTLFIENGWFDKAMTEVEINDITSEISSLINKNIEKYSESGSVIDIHIRRKLIKNLTQPQNGETATLDKILMQTKVNTLNADTKNIIKSFAKEMTNFCADNNALNEYSFNKLAFAPSTSKAKYWNDTVKSVIEVLNITPQEIENTRYDRKLVGELFNRKIWEYAAKSDDEYKIFISKLAEKISKIDKYVKPNELMGRFMAQVDTSFSAAADKFNGLGFKYTAQKINGITDANKKVINETGTLRGVTKAFIQGNVDNLKNTFASLLNKADIYRRLYQNPDLKFLGEDATKLPKAVKEEIAAVIEYLTTEGRISDYSVKLDFIRNLRPDTADKGNLVINEKGIQYSHYTPDKLNKTGGIIKSDTIFFKRVLKAIFGTPISKETETALVEYSSTSSMLNKYRSNMYNTIGNIYNFMYPDHTVGAALDNEKIKGIASPKYRANSVGSALDEMLTNSLRQMYNTRKWLKMFGGFGAGLLGFTVFSQFLFGKGQTSNRKQKKVV